MRLISTFIVILTLLITPSIYAQNCYEIGSTLTYSFQTFGDLDLVKYRVADQVTIQGKNCVHIKSTTIHSTWYQPGPNVQGYRVIRDTTYNDSIFVFQENRAYYYLQDNSFQLLFDFDASIGFSWETDNTWADSDCKVISTVTNKGDTTINGNHHAFLVLEIKDFFNANGTYENRTIIEGFGSTYYPFLPPPVCFPYETTSTLMCAESQGLTTFFNGNDQCEIKLGIDNPNQPKQETYIYPVPLEDRLYLNMEGANNIQMHDMSGKLVLDMPLVAGVNQIDISALGKGIHIATIQTNTYTYKQRVTVLK